eukprot:scaffold13802_cov116-Isochrysis_galbana.AAC.4
MRFSGVRVEHVLHVLLFGDVIFFFLEPLHGTRRARVPRSLRRPSAMCGSVFCSRGSSKAVLCSSRGLRIVACVVALGAPTTNHRKHTNTQPQGTLMTA